MKLVIIISFLLFFQKCINCTDFIDLLFNEAVKSVPNVERPLPKLSLRLYRYLYLYETVAKEGKVFYGQARASKRRMDCHCSWGKLSISCSNATEVAHGQLPVAVHHFQLRTMASETVDPIDWPLLPHSSYGNTP